MNADDTSSSFLTSYLPSIVRRAQGRGLEAQVAKVEFWAWFSHQYQGLIRSYTRYAANADERDDLDQTAAVTALDALQRADAARAAHIGGYAALHIKGAMIRVLDANRRGNVPLIAVSETTAYAKDTDIEVKLDVRAFVASLPEQDQQLLQQVFVEGHKQVEVARMLGVSPARVNQRLQEIYAKGRVALANYRPRGVAA
jgi:RNA polymerase sigma factor (sigma-70 family)